MAGMFCPADAVSKTKKKTEKNIWCENLFDSESKIRLQAEKADARMNKNQKKDYNKKTVRSNLVICQEVI